MTYYGALLDATLAREDLVQAHVEGHAPQLRPLAWRMLAVAADGGDMMEAGRPLDHGARVARVGMLDLVAAWHDKHAPRLRAARERDPSWRSHPPIRNADMAARRLVRTDAELRQGGRIPSLARLSRMTDAELSLVARRFGIHRDRGAMMSEAVTRAAARLGASPDRARVQEAAEAAVSRELRQGAKDLVREYVQAKEEWQPTTTLRWVARLSSVPPATCPSCEDLHDTEATLADWQARGMPGEAATFCRADCCCSLEAT